MVFKRIYYFCFISILIMHKDITFLLNPSEITAGTRGASLGPFALLTAARKYKSNLFGSFPIVQMKDWNHLLDKKSPFKYAKNSDGLLEVYKETSNQLQSIFSSKRFPFLISGDHGSAGGTIAGIKKAFPSKRLGVVWIDAHGDIHSPYTTPSGNMHGMPLCTALNEDNLPCKVNEIAEDEKENWDKLKDLHGIVPKILPSDLVFVGVRDTEEQEERIIDRLGVKNYTVAEIRESDVDTVAASIIEKLSDCDLIYISFDVDSMDPDLTSHGTGTPVPGGLTPEEVLGLMEILLDSSKVCCLELVEINPCLDEKINKMAEISFSIVEKLAAKITGI
jgi:arginase